MADAADVSLRQDHFVLSLEGSSGQLKSSSCSANPIAGSVMLKGLLFSDSHL